MNQAYLLLVWFMLEPAYLCGAIYRRVFPCDVKKRSLLVVLNAPIYMHLYFTPKEPLDIVPAGRML